VDLYLSEKPHIVIQGEGENILKPMIAIRCHICNIQCPGCDAYHTWDKTRISSDRYRISVKDLAEELKQIYLEKGIYHLMITGGEPQLQQEEIKELMEILPVFYQFDIETTGQRDWQILKLFWDRIYFDFSPKIGALTPGIEIKEYLAFNNLPPNFGLKVVCSKENFDANLSEVKEFQNKYKINNNRVYLMPLGMTRDEVVEQLKFLVPKSIENHFNLSPRLHILIYDNQRLV
jgi:organic radical activating enzyme